MGTIQDRQKIGRGLRKSEPVKILEVKTGTRSISLGKPWTPTPEDLKRIAERLAAGERPSGFLAD